MYCFISKQSHIDLIGRCAAEVGQALKEHFDSIPKSQHVVLPDQGLAFQDLDGTESDDSGLEGIL